LTNNWKLFWILVENCWPAEPAWNRASWKTTLPARFQPWLTAWIWWFGLIKQWLF